MASSVIHMVVANEINKVLKRDNNILLIGSIAPDLSKELGENKIRSHFLDDDNTNIPNRDSFLTKYRNKMDDDFVLGYYIHLYTDYLWFKYFIPEIYNSDNKMISKMDGTSVKCNGSMLTMYIYNDYTNLNERLINEYSLDLSIFSQKVPDLEDIIDEIQMDKINVIVNKVSVIIANSKEHKDFVFNIDNIKTFINTCIELIIAQLEELHIM